MNAASGTVRHSYQRVLEFEPGGFRHLWVARCGWRSRAGTRKIPDGCLAKYTDRVITSLSDMPE